MYSFKMQSVETLASAVEHFGSSDDAVYLAGGHTLIPAMKQRLRAPEDVIDLSNIPGLGDIVGTDDGLEIGAMATHAAVAASPVVKELAPVIAELAGGIGDRQVRNRGTIGGSVANNDPAADYPAAVLGLDAKVITDRRTIPSEEFFKAMFETTLEPDEVIRAIHFPRIERATYLKFPNPASRYAMVGVMIARLSTDVRIAITGAAASVFRAADFEMALSESFSESAIAELTLSAETMNDDLHASAEYRAHLCKVLIERGVRLLGDT